MQTLNFRHLKGRRCIKGFSFSLCLIVGYIGRARKAEFSTSSTPCLSTVCACQLSTTVAPWPPFKTHTEKVLRRRRLRTGRFSGWKQGLIICPDKLVEFHLWSSWWSPLHLTHLIRKLFENLIRLRLTVSCNLLQKLLSNSYFSLCRFFTSTALLGILFQNITAPAVRNLLISSINLLVTGFDPLVLPRVSLSMKSAAVSLAFYSIGTSTESNHILSQPLVH